MNSKTCFLFLFLPIVLLAQGLQNSYTNYTMAPPSSFNEGLAGYVNPANLVFLSELESRFAWTTDGPKAASFDNWGLFTGGRGFGFGMFHKNIGEKSITDYKISTGFGSDGLAFGLGYGWTGGDAAFFGYENLVSTGAIIRPNQYLSIGLLGNFSIESDTKVGVGELAPLIVGDFEFTDSIIIIDNTITTCGVRIP